MPAGTTRVTLFGGVSITPGGSQTFNASGTWTAPAGISSVTATGRGGAGNPGNAGAAANPTTFNAVPVVGGTSYPVTVASGGQVNISWNPQ